MLLFNSGWSIPELNFDSFSRSFWDFHSVQRDSPGENHTIECKPIKNHLICEALPLFLERSLFKFQPELCVLIKTFTFSIPFEFCYVASLQFLKDLLLVLKQPRFYCPLMTYICSKYNKSSSSQGIGLSLSDNLDNFTHTESSPLRTKLVALGQISALSKDSDRHKLQLPWRYQYSHGIHWGGIWSFNQAANYAWGEWE